MYAHMYKAQDPGRSQCQKALASQTPSLRGQPLGPIFRIMVASAQAQLRLLLFARE